VTDATASPVARRERDALDRFIAAVPFAIAALIILSVIFWQAAVRKTPTLFTDELKWAQLSRGIAETGHAALRGEPQPFASLYSYLIAPAWWIDSTASAYAAIKYLNAIVMASASIPVYFLARRLVSPTAAVIAALGTMCTSALFYAAFLLPEVLAYPTFALFAYVAFRSLSGGGWRWTLATVALAVVAVEVRKELMCAGAAWAIAAAWLWFFGPRAKRIRAGWSLGDKLGAALLGVGTFIVVNRIASTRAIEWTIVTQNYRHRMWTLGLEAGSALTIGLGILPVIAGLAALWLPERRDDPRWRAFAAFFGASILTFGLYTAVKAAFLSTVFATRVEERNLIYLGPLILVAATVYFSARRPSAAALAAATAFVGWLVLGYGYELDYPYFEAPGYGIVTMANRSFSWDQPTIRFALAIAFVCAAAVAALPFLRRGHRTRRAVIAVAALAVAAWSLTGVITSARGSQAGADAFVAHLPQPLDWVDRLTNGQSVTYLGQALGSNYDFGLGLTEFWNRSVDNVWTLDGSSPGPGPGLTPDLADVDGHLRYDPGGDYVLEDNGVKLIGKPVESQGSLTLVRIDHPWRLSETYYLREPDGWIGSDGGYAYFGPVKRGTLHVEVSRAGFCNASVAPTPVTVRVGPPALNQQRAAVVRRPTFVRHVLVHSCEAVPLEFPVRPPVAVRVHVGKLVRPADYGASESRELGVQFSATVTPKR
jgi:hypothetical protein